MGLLVRHSLHCWNVGPMKAPFLQRFVCVCTACACVHMFYSLTSPSMSVYLGMFLPKGFLCGCFNTHFSLLLVEHRSSPFQIALHAWFNLEPSRKGALSQWLCSWTRQFAWLEYWPKARGSTFQWRGRSHRPLTCNPFGEMASCSHLSELQQNDRLWKLSHTWGTVVTVDKQMHTLWTTGSACSNANQKGNALWNKLSHRFWKLNTVIKMPSKSAICVWLLRENSSGLKFIVKKVTVKSGQYIPNCGEYLLSSSCSFLEHNGANALFSLWSIYIFLSVIRNGEAAEA